MIVIEGMDNTGKSTLAKKLSSKFELKIIKSSGPPKDLKSLIEKVRFSLDQTRKGVIHIYDRYPLISECVYGPALRNKNLFAGYEGYKLIKEFIEIQPIVIYCRPPFPKIEDFRKRKQMKGVRKNTPLLVSAYDVFITRIKTNVEVVYYDFTDKNNYYKVVSRISEYLEGRKNGKF